MDDLEIITEKSKKNIKVLIFNGPPGSGKDTLGNMLYNFMHKNNYPEVFMQSFKEQLIEIALVISGLERSTWTRFYAQKELKRAELGGLSCREYLIKISEKVIKPNFGADYFGKHAADNLLVGLNIFTDGGFEAELPPIIDKIGVENVVIVRLHRTGHTFKNDSRNYISIPGVACFDIKNQVLNDAFTELAVKLGFVKK